MTDAMLADTDLVLLDIKAFDPDIYRKLTGGKVASTQEFAKRLSTMAKPTWIRFVLVPQLTDNYEDIEHLADFVADAAKCGASRSAAVPQNGRTQMGGLEPGIPA